MEKKKEVKNRGVIAETLFWAGLAVIVLSFLYNTIFIVTIPIGLALMILSALENLTSGRLTLKKVNRLSVVSKMLLFLILSLIIIFSLKNRLTPWKKFILKIPDLPLKENWWFYAILGLVIGLVLLFLLTSFYMFISKKRRKVLIKKVAKIKKIKEAKIKYRKFKFIYTMFFVVGIILTVISIISRRLYSLIVGFLTLIVSLLSYKKSKPKEEKLKKIKIEEKKESRFRIKLSRLFRFKIKPRPKKEKLEIKPKKIPKKKFEFKIKPSKLFRFKIKLPKREKPKLEEKIQIKSKKEKIKGLKRRWREQERQRIKEEKRRIREEKKKTREEKRRILEKLKSEKEIKGEEFGVVKTIKQSIAKAEKNETHLDTLLKLVEKYRRLKLSTVAIGFNVGMKEAEEWARILEEHSLSTTHYPAIGEPEIRKIEVAKPEEEKTKTKKEVVKIKKKEKKIKKS